MLFSYVTMIFVGIIIWLAVLHNKVEDLSISLNELKKIVANKQSGMQSNCSDEVVSPEPQKILRLK